MTDATPRPGDTASFADLYTPKLVTVLREGYGLRAFKSDTIAGLTVAIVALPLSMAIAIASGATPAQGLYTAIVGGSSCRCWVARGSRSAGRRGPSSCWSRPPWRCMGSTG